MMIAEVSKKYNLSIDTIRYYERAGLIPRVRRNKSGIRNYGETECSWIEFIKNMRKADVPVETLSQYAALSQQGEPAAGARMRLLMEQREHLNTRLEEINRALEDVNRIIRQFDAGETTNNKQKEETNDVHIGKRGGIS